MKRLLALAVLVISPAALADQQYTTYVTKSGDGLYSIARRFGTTPAQLIKLNAIQNPDKLYRGMRLKVPAPAKVDRTEQPDTPPPNGQKQVATVGAGSEPAPTFRQRAQRPAPTEGTGAESPTAQPAVSQPSAVQSKPAPVQTQRGAQAKPSGKPQATAVQKRPASFLPDYTTMQEATGTKSIASLIAGVVLKLAFVIVLVWVCAKAMRSLSMRSYRGRAGARMAVLDSLALGPNRGLYIVRAAGRYLLLGVTNERIDVLSELPPDAVPDDAEAEGHFGGMLDRLLGGDPTAPTRVGSLLDRTAQHLRRRAQEAQEGTKSWES